MLAHGEETEHVLGSQSAQGVGVALKAFLLYDSCLLDAGVGSGPRLL